MCQAERIVQAPSIDAVSFVAAGHFALAVSLGALWMNGKDAALGFQEAFNDGAVFGLDGNGHVGKRREFFAELLPATGRVLETKVGDNFATGIQDDDVVMIFGPVEAGVMCDLIPCFHTVDVWFA